MVEEIIPVEVGVNVTVNVVVPPEPTEPAGAKVILKSGLLDVTELISNVAAPLFSIV